MNGSSLTLLLLILCSPFVTAQESGEIDFNRDIRPILAENCFACHGPDAAVREADLRLDTPAGIYADLGAGYAAIVPGDLDMSVLLERVRAEDSLDRMPPEEAGKELTAEEIASIEAWIRAGAEWQEHWSFMSAERPEIPVAKAHASWPKNPIDDFVLARMSAAGLQPGMAAEPATWLRRVSLDLTGLPPSLRELDDFLSDKSAQAKDRVLDRLFASPRYGEHMASAWLDAARYADTHGYHYDNERSMWRWRDWVIDAYNRNLPFDQFTVEQLAGDLLEEPSLEQRIATGFNRNHPINWEGGIIPAEYLNEYVVDRVDTTSTVWMGLTMGCARCHDHKFDPISQREYYQFYDFFNQVAEQGADGQQGNAAPFLPVPSEDQRRRSADLEAAILSLEAERAIPNPELDLAQEAWTAEIRSRDARDWQTLEPFSFHAWHAAELELQADQSLLAKGPHAVQEVYELISFTELEEISAIRLEAMADVSLPGSGPGRASHSNIVLSEFEVEIAPLHAPSRREPVKFVAAEADHEQENFAAVKAIDGINETGWALSGAAYGEDRIAVFVPDRPFGFAGGTALRILIRHESQFSQHAIGRFRLAVSGSTEPGFAATRMGPWQKAGPLGLGLGRKNHSIVYPPEAAVDPASELGMPAIEWRPVDDLDGRVHSFDGGGRQGVTYLRRHLDAPEDREVVAWVGSDDGIRIWLNGELVHDRDVPRGAAPDQDSVPMTLRRGANELLLKIVDHGGESGYYFVLREDLDLGQPLSALSAVLRPEAPRHAGKDARVQDLFRSMVSTEWRESKSRLDELAAAQRELSEEIPSTMIMQERSERRVSRVLMRGAYDRPLEEVQAAVPASLPELAADRPANRLALARWLVDPKHPLTSRVQVNRLWARSFGRGLVETLDDFGVQGALPSHPELLDWLAVEFTEEGWDVQSMLRLIMTSATYAQDSAASTESLLIDPENRWLARGARFRLSAEEIRDQALYVSGLLIEKLGGPSVKPYQPEGLWREVGSDVNGFTANRYMPGEGEDLYRRSLYTFRKRSVPPPNLLVFDANARETCMVARERTNTPLQALVLLNDPTYVEAARALAQRMLTDDHGTDRERIDSGLRRILGRPGKSGELEMLAGLLVELRATYTEDEESARQLIAVGMSPPPQGIDAAELAAWTLLASTVLNLDEAINRN